MEGSNKLIIFENKRIRRVWYKDNWWFSVVDVVGVLTGSPNSNNYWKVLKHRENQLVTNCNQLKLKSSDGKMYLTDCANKEGLFRIIQSIPSKKAEPFKLWLAKVGSERIDEIENPELAQERIKAIYEQKGYPKRWIEERLRGIAIRQDLTDEWKNRGIEENRDFAILTNEIAKATFGVGTKEHKRLKGLKLKFKNQNLRDHMSDWELILTMFGEKATTDITKEKNSKGLKECKDSAKEGGEAANEAKKSVEKRIGKSIISKKNFLSNQEKKLV